LNIYTPIYGKLDCKTRERLFRVFSEGMVRSDRATLDIVTTSKTSLVQAPFEAGDVPSGASTQGRCLRIAVLLDCPTFFGWGYQAQLRDALDVRCRARGHDLLMLYGGALDGPDPSEMAENAIFNLVQPGSFDGIIAISTLLGAFRGPQRVSQLIDTYKPANLCSFGIALPGVPSLVLDDRTGMETVVEHMVRNHGCRRLAFLTGVPQNPEAEARFAAYRDVLARHAIDFDPALVACGYFRPGPGRLAMEEILARKVDFDGVVAANDIMALGAIQALRKHGRRVPQDVLVAGFDDMPLARLGNPPMTTVAQPFESLAYAAIQIIEDQVAGRAVPECTRVPARFVCRQSCGCNFERPTGSAAPDVAAKVMTAEHLRARSNSLGRELAGELMAGADDGSLAATQLLAGLHAEAAGESDAFARAVNELLEAIGDDNEGHRRVEGAIGCLRNELRCAEDLQVERALYDGLDLVALSSMTTQMQHRLALDENYVRLLTLGSQAAVAFDLSSLRDTLVRALPAAGVHTAFLSCVPEDAADTDLEPVLCMIKDVPIQLSVARFPSSRLLPPGVMGPEQRRTLLVFPITAESRLLGVIAFDNADGINAYPAFRNEVAAVLKSIRLHQELVRKTMLHERSVQERLATTKRMDALSVLAGGVAHDLNNALGPLVALPDVILSELRKVQANEDTLRDLRADVETIKTSSLRAAQTIKDLLTLSRQGRTVKENLNLNRVVKSCLAEISMHFASDKSRHINMMIDFSPEPQRVRGSEAQLARAVGNLVRNAVEAIDGEGEVVIKTSRARVATAIGHFETIPAGDYAVLSVTDDGCGIPDHELARIFEPFFTKKRASEHAGSGLGLAIVHGVVKEHEGFIDVTSVLERGTTFSLYLPAVQEAQEDQTMYSVTRGAQAKILVVDDDAIQLRTFRRILVHLGYEVETIQSGLRAYEVFSQAAQSGQSPYDLVILDMVLDEMIDGLQVFELIQRLFPAQKAIVVSGHAPSERAELAVNKGLTWLTKPYGIETLARAVERVLAGNGVV